MYVNDLTLAACGLPQRIVATMISAVDFVIDMMERVLLMEVSTEKSKVIAGRPSIAVAVSVGVASKKVNP